MKNFKNQKFESFYSQKMTLEAYENRASQIADKVYFNRSLKKIQSVLSTHQIDEQLSTFKRLVAEIENEVSLEKNIRDFLTKTTQESFVRFFDKNELTKEIQKNYLSKEGTPLDIQAIEISDNGGIKVEIDDILDFMKKYPKRNFETENEIELEIFLENFKNETGVNLTSKFVKIYYSTLLNSLVDFDDCPF
jgi:hypothetical protein